MQVLKKYVFLFAAFILTGCSSSNRTAPAITGYDTAVMYENLNSYDSINLINRDVINDGNFRVGMLLPLSGEASKYGQGLKNAALMALDDVQNDNLILQFYDTQSTASGARVAVENAIAQNASLIIGPLMSTSVNAIKDETTYKDIPVIAFSTNESVLEPQVYTLGLLVDEQVNRIISYAASQKRSRFALLLPDNQTGIAIARAAVNAAQQNGASISKISFYPPNTSNFADPVKNLTDYDIRSNRLKRIRSSLTAQANKGNMNAKRALKRLERIQALGDVDFDAVIIPESGSRLKSAFSMFGYYDVYAPKVKFLGTAIWENTDLSKETMAAGAWYPALSRSHSTYFANKYSEMFGEKPHSLYSLAYDAVALAASLSKKGNENLNGAITAPEGYIGINGVFRLFANGTNEHSLDIVEITENGDKVVSPAPRKFNTAPEYGFSGNNVYVTPDYKAPQIFGKNTEAAQIAIYGRVLEAENQPVYEIPQDSEMEIIRKALKELNVVIPQ